MRNSSSSSSSSSSDNVLSALGKSFHRFPSILHHLNDHHSGFCKLTKPTTSRLTETATETSPSSVVKSIINNLTVAEPQSPNPQHYGISQFTTSMSNRLETFMMEYITAVTIGASLGAAVVSGLGVGLMTSTFFVSGFRRLANDASNFLMRICLVVGEKLSKKKKSEKSSMLHNNNNNNNNNNQQQQQQQQQSSGESTDRQGEGGVCVNEDDNVESRNSRWKCGKSSNISFLDIHGDDNNIALIRGDAFSGKRSDHHNEEDQCRECLDQIGAILSKNELCWRNVRKVTAYLVDGRCDASTFRNVLAEYPLSESREKHRDDDCTSCVGVMITLLFVRRLEDDRACVQVEVMVSG